MAEKGGGQVGRELAMQDRGAKQNLVELRPVPPKRRLMASGAVKIFPDEVGYPAAGTGAQVVNGRKSLMQVHKGVSWRGLGKCPAKPTEHFVNFSLIPPGFELDCRP